jgi:hypothetical protein
MIIMNVNATTRGFIPELWDAKVYRTLEDNLILEQMAKAPLENKAGAKGDTVYFSDLGDPTISDYIGTLTSEELNDSQMSMLINYTKTFCFNVKDLDKLMANADLQGSQTQRAGYNLADSIERYVLRYVADEANAGTALTATVTSATAISTIQEVARQLMENNVKEGNMFIAIPPWFKLKLEMAGIAFQINTGINGTGGMAWSDQLGFKTLVTNTIYNSNTQAAPISTIIGGSYQAIGFDKVQLPVRTVELSASRKTQIDGGAAFGFKVVKPKELSKLTATFGAETAI